MSSQQTSTEQDKITKAKRAFREALSRKLYMFTDNVLKEQVVDFTVLFLRKKNIRHTPEDLANILEVFKMAIEDSYMKNIDGLLNNIDKDVDKVLEDTNPLISTDSKKQPKSVQQTQAATKVSKESVKKVKQNSKS